MENVTALGRIQCQLQVVTPIHIGCDEVYEPTGFVVDEEQERLIVFDPTGFFEQLDQADRERFSAICRKGTIASILEVYKFFRNRAVEGRMVKLCRGFTEHYSQVLSLTPQEAKMQLNRFEIRRTAFSPVDNRPYIPGSAIKGALRTGYLNALALKGQDYSGSLRQGKEKNKRWDDRHKVLENKLLALDRSQPKDRISKDPFRMVKVSDFMPVGKVETRIIYAVNWKKSPSGGEGRGPYQMLEVITPGTRFVGEIKVDMPQSKDAVSTALSLNELTKGCRLFFQDEKSREDRELQAIGCKSVEQADEDGNMPFRVGQHSGAECVTIEGYREIWIKGKTKGRSLDHATTLWLASELGKPKNPDFLTPFGWSVLEDLSPEGIKSLMEEERSFRIDRDRSSLERAEAARARLEKEKEEEERLQRLMAEKEAEKAAEEKRIAELEAMSPGQRAIAELEAGDAPENRVIEIYNTLDGLSSEDKMSLAKALKIYWQASGKWMKKNCSKKQWIKVQKVKAILGE
ncbi:MAG: type III-A CRISPR-associated RAMP protein Csm5 [Desulfatiglandales bacterium]